MKEKRNVSFNKDGNRVERMEDCVNKTRNRNKEYMFEQNLGKRKYDFSQKTAYHQGRMDRPWRNQRPERSYHREQRPSWSNYTFSKRQCLSRGYPIERPARGYQHETRRGRGRYAFRSLKMEKAHLKGKIDFLQGRLWEINRILGHKPRQRSFRGFTHERTGSAGV